MLIAEIATALAFAADKHRNQRRKDVDASPYINHPIDLLDVLCSAGVSDKNALIGSVLHDTLEDTQTTADELTRIFGAVVTQVVCEVTDDKSLPKADRKRLQIEHASTISDSAKLVKCADKICNLRDLLERPPAGWDVSQIRKYFDWAKAVVDQLRGVSPALEAVFDQVYARRP